MSNLQPGDLVLVEIPYTDLTATKKRPSVILSVSRKDFLVAFITSRVERAGKDDVLIPSKYTNGLAVDSAVLVQKLFTIHESLIARKLGSCTTQERRIILKAVIKKLEEGI